MWKLTSTIELNDDEWNVYLSIPKNSCFHINKVYYYDYNCSLDGNWIRVSAFSDEIDKEKALQECFLQMRIANRIMSYLVQYAIGVNISYYDNKGFVQVQYVDCKINTLRSNNLKKIIDFMDRLTNLSEQKRKEALRCIQFYSRSLDLYYGSDLYEEAILNNMKAIEIIVNSYIKDNGVENKLRTSIKTHFDRMLDEVLFDSYNKNLHYHCKSAIEDAAATLLKNLKIKVRFCVKKFKIKSVSESDIEQLIKFRNEVVAHGNLSNLTEKEAGDLFYKSLVLCSELLSLYFFDMPYKKIYLKVKINSNFNNFIR